MRRLLALVSFAACSKDALPPIAPTPPKAVAGVASVPNASAAIASAAIAPAAIAPAVAVTPVAQALSTLPTFAQTGEIYMLVVEKATPSCEAWSNDPSAHRLTNVVTRGNRMITRSIDYTLDGANLVIAGIARADLEAGKDTGDSYSEQCTQKLAMRETAQALLVSDGSTWFRTRGACAAAINARARVATSVCMMPLDDDEDFYLKPHAPTRAKFDALLAKGGTLYGGDGCLAVRVIPDATRGDSLTGRFEWDWVRDDGMKATDSLGYSLRRGQTTIWITGPDTWYADGTSHSAGCLDEDHVTAHNGYVELDAPAYFTKRACNAALKAETKGASWFPAIPGDEAPIDKSLANTSRNPPILGC